MIHRMAHYYIRNLDFRVCGKAVGVWGSTRGLNLLSRTQALKSTDSETPKPGKPYTLNPKTLNPKPLNP